MDRIRKQWEHQHGQSKGTHTTLHYGTWNNTRNTTRPKCLSKQAFQFMGHYLYADTSSTTAPNNTRNGNNCVWQKIGTQAGIKTTAIDPNCAHFNLIGAIRNLRKELTLSLKFKHVKGHQDRRQPTAHSWFASMNIEMNEWAKQAIQAGYQGLHQYQIPGKGWCCYINKEQITKQLATKLRNHINSIYSDTLEKQKWYGWGNTTMVEWELAESVIQSILVLQWKWNLKMAANFLPHWSNKKQWQLCTEDQCPCCH